MEAIAAVVSEGTNAVSETSEGGQLGKTRAVQGGDKSQGRLRVVANYFRGG